MIENDTRIDPKVIVALDFDNAQQALAFVEPLTPDLCKLKVGKELFAVAGPALVEKLVGKGFDVFLDLKYHDIPNTVAKACQAAAKLGVWMLNVHALGGRRMMMQAKEAISTCEHQPLLIAVTILTSHSDEELHEIGLQGTAQENVLRLAQLAEASGLDGVVCSAQEAEALRAIVTPEFQLVTPGIRPANAALGDQTRVMTPDKAIQAGANYLVIGRPITQSKDPIETLKLINASL